MGGFGFGFGFVVMIEAVVGRRLVECIFLARRKREREREGGGK